ncbi:MAG: UDP-3-O-(3-hydroxymyristoyl)glucosamine N-acyltransferase [Acidobacteriota bacterium]
MTLEEISRKLGCELKGPADLEIRGVAGMEEARADELTFLSNPKYVKQLHGTRAGAVIVSPDAPKTDRPVLVSRNPYLSFAQAIELFYAPPHPLPGIHPTAVVADTAEIGEGHSIGANVVIGEGVRIGARATIHPNVTIYPYAEIGDDFLAHSNSVVREHCRIGHRVILQNGSVIGADGFGFAPREDRSYYKIVQSGRTVLEDDVEVGANACVDRATIGETRIGRGTKLDNLVQIGHGSRVGQDNVLAAQVGLAGSTRIENRVMLAGQVGVAGHLTIGDEVIATAQTGIARSVEAGSRISGTPEMDSGLWKKNYLLMHEFPELVKTVKRLVREVEELKAAGQQR